MIQSDGFSDGVSDFCFCTDDEKGDGTVCIVGHRERGLNGTGVAWIGRSNFYLIMT